MNKKATESVLNEYGIMIKKCCASCAMVEVHTRQSLTGSDPASAELQSIVYRERRKSIGKKEGVSK